VVELVLRSVLPRSLLLFLLILMFFYYFTDGLLDHFDVLRAHKHLLDYCVALMLGWINNWHHESFLFAFHLLAKQFKSVVNLLFVIIWVAFVLDNGRRGRLFRCHFKTVQ